MTTFRILLAAVTGASVGLLIAALVLVAGGPTNAPREEAAVVTDYVMRNGLAVVHVQLPVARTAVMMWYRAGAADDPPGRPGLAHYAEHVTFSALGAHDDSGDRDTFDPGRRPQAFTSSDATTYYQLVAPKELANALRLEARRMGSLRVSADAVEAERTAVLDERWADIDNDPHGSLEEWVQRTVFRATPYANPIVASVGATAGIGLADVTGFLERWYAPNNAVLVVVGAIDAAELRELVEAEFGTIPARAVPPRQRPAPDFLQERIRVPGKEPPARLFWARTYVGPSHGTADPARVASVQLGARILIERVLAARHESVQQFWMEYEPDVLGPAGFSLHAQLANGADVESFERWVEAELTRVGAAEISDAELKTALKAEMKELDASWRDPIEIGTRFGGALVVGRSVGQVLSWPTTLLAVAPADIGAAMRALATSGRVTALTTGPVSGPRDRH